MVLTRPKILQALILPALPWCCFFFLRLEVNKCLLYAVLICDQLHKPNA